MTQKPKRQRTEPRRRSDRMADPSFAAKVREGDRLRVRLPHPALVALLERAKDEKRLDEVAALLASMLGVHALDSV
jgi:hypothetical protein